MAADTVSSLDTVDVVVDARPIAVEKVVVVLVVLGILIKVRP